MPAASFLDFVQLGVRHIFTGYDHLFLLFGLLLASPRWSRLLVIITCFTAGHSVTLALATLGVVHLSPRITEPLIALTIVLVGLENCRPREEAPLRRGAIVLLFGLVHGFGFATALREAGAPAAGAGIAMPLLGFNLGVELGQLGVIALMLPLAAWLWRDPERARRWVPRLSLLVVLMGLYWLVERVLGN